MSEKNTTTVRILICGSGASAHALAGIISSQEGMEARILTQDPAKVSCWNSGKNDGHITVSFEGESQPSIRAKPAMVTTCPQEAARDCDMVIFAIPAFTHATYLRLLQPYIEDGCVIVGMPGQNGFELEVRALLGDRFGHCVLLSFDTLPWICRIVEFGQEVCIAGTKNQMAGALQGSLETARITDPVGLIHRILGPLPKLNVSGHMLGITLMALNAYSHPPMMYGRWKDWDGEPMATKPYFYRDIDFETADLMEKISAEVVATSKRIMDLYPEIDLSQVIPMYDWDIACYGDVIEDTTNEMTVLQTNPGYRDIQHPMIELEDGRFKPNFEQRFLTEDVPFGLAVIRGVTEIVGVDTPYLDEVLLWCQEKLGQEYLVDGRMVGKDLDKTRCPQYYGFRNLSQLLGLSELTPECNESRDLVGQTSTK